MKPNRCLTLAGERNVVGVIMCFFMQVLTILFSLFTSDSKVHGSYNITTAPCSILCNHLSLGTNLRKNVLKQ